MLNLDTHILIKAFDGSLTPHERNVLTADPEWSISAIVRSEIKKPHQFRRIEYGLDMTLLRLQWIEYRSGPSRAKSA